MLFNTTTDGTDYSSVVSSSDTLTESSESFSQSVASLRTDYINPDSGNSTQQPHGMKTRTVLVYPNRSHSDSDSPGIVSPSTVWVPPSTDDSTSHTDVDTAMVTVLEMSLKWYKDTCRLLYKVDPSFLLRLLNKNSDKRK